MLPPSSCKRELHIAVFSNRPVCRRRPGLSLRTLTSFLSLLWPACAACCAESVTKTTRVTVHTSPYGVGGGQSPKKKTVCVPKIGLKFAPPPPCNTFYFSREEIFWCGWVGGLAGAGHAPLGVRKLWLYHPFLRGSTDGQGWGWCTWNVVHGDVGLLAGDCDHPWSVPCAGQVGQATVIPQGIWAGRNEPAVPSAAVRLGRLGSCGSARRRCRPAESPPGTLAGRSAGRTIKIVGWRAQRQRHSIFFVHASLSSNHPCFERQISKTGCYTNVVCCKVTILHSELFPGSSHQDEKALLSHKYLHAPKPPRHTSPLEVCMWQ